MSLRVRTVVACRIIVACWIVALAGLCSANDDVRREIAFPDVAGYKTLKCDFHQHTVFSDGEVWPTVRVAEAWRQGLDAIMLSDHIEYQPHKEDVSTKLGRSHEIALAAARQAGVLLIRGAEITRETPPGHFNAMFLSDVTPLKTDDFLDAVGAAAKQQAFIFWNHQAWKGEDLGRWLDIHTTLYERKWLHAMEVCNGPEYYPTAHRWAMEKNLGMVGNSDIHEPDLRRESLPGNHRTMTLVFAKAATEQAVKEALFQQRTAVWCMDRLIGRRQWLEPLAAGSMHVEPIHLRAKDAVWLRVRNTSDVDIRLEPHDAPTSGHKTLLPARGTTVLKFTLSKAEQQAATAPVTRTFVAANFLIEPGKGLPVSITAAPAK